MKQGIHRLWILLLTVLPWAGVSAGPALAAVQADLAREADRAAAEQAARRLIEGSPVDGAGDRDSPATHRAKRAAESQRSTDEGRYVTTPSAIKPGDSDSHSSVDLAAAGASTALGAVIRIERSNPSAGVVMNGSLHYPIYRAQAPPQG